MGQIFTFAYFLAFIQLFVGFKGISAQVRVLVDVEEDIPQNGAWDFGDCNGGYANDSTGFNCQDIGGINIPPGDRNGEQGFWTKCTDRCLLKYTVQPGDFSFKARLYQSNIQTEVSYDGVIWDYVPGDGWVEISKTFGDSDAIILRFDHFAEDWFNLLDKIVINGDFDPPTDPTTISPTTKPVSSTSTEETSTTTSTTTSPECPSPEPCHCCDQCYQSQPKEIHHYHHHYYYPPSSSTNQDPQHPFP